MKFKVVLVFAILLTLLMIVSTTVYAKTKPPFEDKWTGTDTYDGSTVKLSFKELKTGEWEFKYKDKAATLLCGGENKMGVGSGKGEITGNTFLSTENTWKCNKPGNPIYENFDYLVEYNSATDTMIDSDGVEFTR
jgi:hypothetical protein